VHDIASVDFYCGLARSDFGGNLLIQHSGDDESHNLLLPCSQCAIVLLQIVDLGLLLLRGAVTL
jgi:hypothetical protein